MKDFLQHLKTVEEEQKSDKNSKVKNVLFRTKIKSNILENRFTL